MIWLIGCEGLLGKEVGKQLTENKIHWIGTDKEVDITDFKALNNFEKSIETASYYVSDNLSHQDKTIKWIINCASFTNVEDAENNPEEAEKINTTGALNIARMARKIGAKLIHISTDYVFNGNRTKPYSEEMERDPINIYGKTKSDGEIAIEKEIVQYYIIRTSWLYGFEGKNFVYTMTKLMNQRNSIKVVNDQKGTPTFAPNLAKVILMFIDKSDNAKELIGPKSAPSFGVYHYSDSGETTWFDFANQIYKYGKKAGHIKNECSIEACSSKEFESKVNRPAYSVLNKDKIIKEFKIKIPNWQYNLEHFIKNNKFKTL